jgi:hypothetical protein
MRSTLAVSENPREDGALHVGKPVLQAWYVRRPEEVVFTASSPIQTWVAGMTGQSGFPLKMGKDA